ncbi:MAG TPA: hypothetical protein VJ853_13395, partial [Thermoanaerobaculia bacterium]|nr:hypothetical protein [Thermoanaerobaculia bacterium]
MRALVSLLLTFAAAAAFGQSDAKASFDRMKTLAGVWEGRMHTDPVMKEVEGTATRVTMRVTSMGNAMMHEITSSV